MTREGLTFLLTTTTLCFLGGFSVTGGLWCFCKLTKWAPVNLTVNISKNAAIDD